jgi:hypothetical protein
MEEQYDNGLQLMQGTDMCSLLHTGSNNITYYYIGGAMNQKIYGCYCCSIQKSCFHLQKSDGSLVDRLKEE